MIGLLARRPFTPLRVCTVDNAEYVVRDPLHMGVAKTQVFIGIDPDDTGLPTNAVHLAPNHVSRMIPIDPTPPTEADPSAGGENGTQRS